MEKDTLNDESLFTGGKWSKYDAIKIRNEQLFRGCQLALGLWRASHISGGNLLLIPSYVYNIKDVISSTASSPLWFTS